MTMNIARSMFFGSLRIQRLNPKLSFLTVVDCYAGGISDKRTLRVNLRFNHSFIRNVGVVAHIDAGKTTTSEQMLYLSGTTKNIGRVDSGDTVMDFLPQERERGITISSAAISFNWRGFSINLIDTPGHVDFTVEVERSARVLDGIILVIDAVAGVQAQTQTVWKQTRKQNISAIAFINKMDRDGANFENACKSVNEKLHVNIAPIQMAIGSESSFEGVIDLIAMQKITWTSVSASKSFSSPMPPKIFKVSIGDEEYVEAQLMRMRLLETLADIDDLFMKIYLESNEHEIKVEDITQAIRRLCVEGLLVPAICGSSLKGKGVEMLLNCVTAFLPAPSDRPEILARNKLTSDVKTIHPINTENLCALVFKITHDKDRGKLVFVRVYSGVLDKRVIRNATRGEKERINQLLLVHADDYEVVNEIKSGGVGCIVGMKNAVTGDTLVADGGPFHSYVLDGLEIPPAVFSLSIEPERASQQADLDSALNILTIEDPSLVVESNSESGQTILRGLGELHLEIICERIRREFRIEVSTGRTYIAFRESVKESGERAIRYDKSFGSKRMFAGIRCLIKHLDNFNEPDITICQDVKQHCSIDEYNSLIEGLKGSFMRGPIGYPVVGFSIHVLQIERDQDTSTGAIRAAAVTLVDEMLRSEISALLEPTMAFEADVPNLYVGDILSDLSGKRRAQILDIFSGDASSRILAIVPLAHMLGYASYIRSMTQGEGSFSMEYHTHVEVDVSSIESLL